VSRHPSNPNCKIFATQLKTTIPLQTLAFQWSSFVGVEVHPLSVHRKISYFTQKSLKSKHTQFNKEYCRNFYSKCSDLSWESFDEYAKLNSNVVQTNLDKADWTKAPAAAFISQTLHMRTYYKLS
jgi:hypothetical protein